MSTDPINETQKEIVKWSKVFMAIVVIIMIFMFGWLVGRTSEQGYPQITKEQIENLVDKNFTETEALAIKETLMNVNGYEIMNPGINDIATDIKFHIHHKKTECEGSHDVTIKFMHWHVGYYTITKIDWPDRPECDCVICNCSKENYLTGGVA